MVLAQDQAIDNRALEAQVVKLEADKVALGQRLHNKVTELECLREEMATIPKPAGWPIDRATANLGESN